jgi:hypothetical protein
MSGDMVPYEQVKEMARSAASSGFFPGIKTPEQALVLMALAQAEGIAPIQAMMRYDVIQGRPAKKSQAMLADFLAAGGKVEWLQHGPDCCEAKFSHPHGGTIVVKWDIEKAKKAQLTGKDLWSKYAENMLHARCVSNGVRFVYPAATGGLYDPSEVADFTSDKFASLPQETKPSTAAQEPSLTANQKESPVFPDIPDFVTTIPSELCKGVFKPLAEFDGTPLQKLSIQDLEFVISLVSDNRNKVRNDKAKSWLLAIEATATVELRNAQLEDMPFPATEGAL